MLQDPKMILESAVRALESLKLFVESKRDEFVINTKKQPICISQSFRGHGRNKFVRGGKRASKSL